MQVFAKDGAQRASRNLTFRAQRDHQNLIAEDIAKCGVWRTCVAGASRSAVNLHARTGSAWSLHAGQAARSATFSAIDGRQTACFALFSASGMSKTCGFAMLSACPLRRVSRGVWSWCAARVVLACSRGFEKVLCCSLCVLLRGAGMLQFEKRHFHAHADRAQQQAIVVMCFAQAFQRLAQGNSGSHCAKEAMEAASMAECNQHSAIMFACRGHCKVRCFCGWGLHAGRSDRETECLANVAWRGHHETRCLADVARRTLGKTLYFASGLSEENEKLILGR